MLCSSIDNSDSDSSIPLSPWCFYWAPDETVSLASFWILWSKPGSVGLWKGQQKGVKKTNRGLRAGRVEYNTSNGILIWWMNSANYLTSCVKFTHTHKCRNKGWGWGWAPAAAKLHSESQAGKFFPWRIQYCNRKLSHLYGKVEKRHSVQCSARCE